MSNIVQSKQPKVMRKKNEDDDDAGWGNTADLLD
jgi:hypothetical protein